MLKKSSLLFLFLIYAQFVSAQIIVKTMVENKEVPFSFKCTLHDTKKYLNEELKFSRINAGFYNSYKEQNYAEAAKNLETILKADPDNYIAETYRIELSHNIENILEENQKPKYLRYSDKDYLRSFLQIYKKEPCYYRMMIFLGIRLFTGDDLKKLLSTAVDLAPQSDFSYHTKAYLLRNDGRYAEVEKALENLGKLDTPAVSFLLPSGYYRLANSEFDDNKINSEKHFRKALDGFKNLTKYSSIAPFAYDRILNAYFLLGEYKNFEINLGKYQEIVAKDHYNLLFQQGQLAMLKMDYSKCTDLNERSRKAQESLNLGSADVQDALVNEISCRYVSNQFSKVVGLVPIYSKSVNPYHTGSLKLILKSYKYAGQFEKFKDVILSAKESQLNSDQKQYWLCRAAVPSKSETLEICLKALESKQLNLCEKNYVTFVLSEVADFQGRKKDAEGLLEKAAYGPCTVSEGDIQNAVSTRLSHLGKRYVDILNYWINQGSVGAMLFKMQYETSTQGIDVNVALKKLEARDPMELDSSERSLYNGVLSDLYFKAGNRAKSLKVALDSFQREKSVGSLANYLSKLQGVKGAKVAAKDVIAIISENKDLISHHPLTPLLAQSWADALIELKDYDKAISILKDSLKVEKEYYTYYLLAYTYAKMKNDCKSAYPIAKEGWNFEEKRDEVKGLYMDLMVYCNFSSY